MGLRLVFLHPKSGREMIGLTNIRHNMCQGLTPYIADGHPTFNSESLYWVYKPLLQWEFRPWHNMSTNYAVDVFIWRCSFNDYFYALNMSHSRIAPCME